MNPFQNLLPLLVLFVAGAFFACQKTDIRPQALPQSSAKAQTNRQAESQIQRLSQDSTQIQTQMQSHQSPLH